MFFNRSRKMVRSIIFGHEVEIRDGCWGNSSDQGIPAGVTDGGWRKSREEIRVVRGIFHQMFFFEIAVKVLDSIDDGWIALEGHVFLQPIVEDCRDERLFLAQAGFLLDDGCEDYGILFGKLQS